MGGSKARRRAGRREGEWRGQRRLSGGSPERKQDGSGGGAQGPRREWGGEWEEEPRRRGMETLAPRLVAGEGGSAGTCPVPTRVGGTGEGDAVRELGRLGRPGWLRARGVGRWPCGWVGLPGPGGFPPFFCFFVISFFYLFSLSVLFSFRAFRHFIKMCLLYYNYPDI